MKYLTQTAHKLATLASIAFWILISGSNAHAALLSLSDTPLFLNVTAPPLNMLVIGRDHKLFMAAYNDVSDLDGDGVLDVGYKGYVGAQPTQIDYFGYFDSYKCYSYSSGVFVPSSKTSDKTCDGSHWSGDFLNYVTTARIDALRKVLYGGYRSTDSTSSTVLERSYIPQDAHSWGKEYQSQARDGYDIKKYTTYSAPSSGKYILFANTTLTSTLTSSNYRNPNGAPLMRVMSGTTHRVWEWLSKEAPVAGSQCANTGSWSSVTCDVTPDDYTVRAQVCVAGLLESNCKQYPNSSYKPTGLLHQYGENNQMYFGLLSGSYTHNFEGGVVRKEVTSFTDEVDSNTGIFSNPKKGMIASLDGFKIEDSTSYNATYSHNYNCGNYWNQTQSDGNCRIWGNPVGEMMFESLRYFAGASSPSSQYTYSSSGSDDAALGLPEVTTWRDPYKSTASGGLGYAVCAKPFDTVISDVNTSRDSELPGSPWNGNSFSLPTKISSLDVSSMGQKIWNNEFGTGTKNIFIGEVGGTADGMPTVKTASSFGNIRGLSPEEPTRQGTYYSASVAYFGHINDINSATGTQNLNTYAVAMSSPIPRMEIPINGKTITLVPLGKVVCGPSGVTCSGNISNGSWQPTEQIVAFYIDTMKNMPGQSVDSSTNGGRPYIKFRINFEDAEQGNDYDMDEIVLYTVAANADGTLSIQLTTEYASAGYESHIGYVISGTTKDGVYLEVAGGGSTTSGSGGKAATHYTYDTPNLSTSQKWAGDCVSSPSSCSFITGVTSTAVRNFTPGSAGAATLLNDPLWYAAKYGGFSDNNKNSLADNGEWNSKVSTTPDNYFLVTNALTLGTQMAEAFDEIIQHTASASSASVNSGTISSDSRVYQAIFHSGDWLGHLVSYPVNSDGSLSSTAEWDAADKLPDSGSRNIYTTNTSGTPVAFTWSGIDSTQKSLLNSNSTIAQQVLNYIRGDGTNEASNGGTFRNRATKLGDIINSSPIYVGGPSFYYSDTLESSPYSSFQSSNKNRTAVVYVGANDGMLHAFDATTGVEKFAYIPSSVVPNLNKLTNTSYSHKYYVDGSPNSGDVFFGGAWHTVVVGGLNNGGQGIYALDVTNPDSFSTSKVLWEFTDKNDKDLGYTFSQPAIVRLKSGKWAAVFGNGYNNSTADTYTSTTGHAVLYVVDISNGSLIKKIDTQVGTATTPNGLATPAVVDIDGDSTSDYVYAGDLQGNLWKFNIQDTDPTKWSIPYTNSSGNPAPLYIAKDASGNVQPITSRPELSRGNKGVGMMVYFGTGKWLEDSDKTVDTSSSGQRTQTLYGIYDPNTGTVTADVFTGRSNLTQQTILAELSVASSDGTSSSSFRVTSDNPVGVRGWYLDLISPVSGYQGERMVANPIYRDGRIIFTTLIPQSDPCTYGGDSWLMELNALNGGRLTISPYDVNRDGKIDSNDYVTVTVGGKTLTVAVSGQKSDVGITTEPGILSDRDKPLEFKYTAGTSGDIQTTTESVQPRSTGRQSWRQVK